MSNNASRVISMAADFGIPVSEQQAELLLKHVSLVNEKNRTINLTRITSIDDAIDRHIVDSLLYLKEMESLSDNSYLCDIGTGAGFPGVPIAVMTDFSVDMVDSVGKKVACVDSFIDELGLSTRCRALHVRVEDLAQTNASKYDYVTARAVAKLRVLIEYAAPLLSLDGSLIASKGNLADDEFEDANRTAKICGMKIVSRETFELPNESGHREILKFVKIRKPSVKLPRRIGEAKAKPLF
jgi:16S rRNA (guanine527-N7)-methyltransferase